MIELTEREVKVCELMRCGLDNKEIGKRMGVSVKTVDVYIHNLKRKAGYNARSIWAASLLTVHAKASA